MFAYAEYSAFLERSKARAPLFPLRDSSGQPGIILRHDVDLDVEPALQLSEVEASVGVRSSFFFLVTADTYNVQAAVNRRALGTMHAAGFEIGLHFDPSIYETAVPEELDVHARREAGVLENIIGAAVTSVSLHNPSIRNEFPLLPSFKNAYDPSIFRPEIYLSDSRLIFRTDPDVFVSSVSGVAQLLFHPEHFSTDGAPYPAIFRRFTERILRRTDSTFRVNSTFVTQCPEPLATMLGAVPDRVPDHDGV